MAARSSYPVMAAVVVVAAAGRRRRCHHTLVLAAAVAVEGMPPAAAGHYSRLALAAAAVEAARIPHVDTPHLRNPQALHQVVAVDILHTTHLLFYCG